MLVTLSRDTHCEFGTFGRLIIGDEEFQTVEQDWENNEEGVSCVPNGLYDLIPYDSNKHGSVYVLRNHELGIGIYKGDSDRWGCLIHVANKASQLEGCIAPGKRRGILDKHWSVSSSGTAMKEIRQLLGDDEHQILIESSFPDFKVVK